MEREGFGGIIAVAYEIWQSAFTWSMYSVLHRCRIKKAPETTTMAGEKISKDTSEKSQKRARKRTHARVQDVWFGDLVCVGRAAHHRHGLHSHIFVQRSQYTLSRCFALWCWTGIEDSRMSNSSEEPARYTDLLILPGFEQLQGGGTMTLWCFSSPAQEKAQRVRIWRHYCSSLCNLIISTIYSVLHWCRIIVTQKRERERDRER